MAHIDFHNVTVRYGKKTALAEVTLEIPKRSIFAIIGPANSGKTTLLKCINRTIDFTSSARVTGEILVDGENVYRLRNVYELRRRVGMVFPLPVGLPMSVYNNVAFGPRVLAMHKQRNLDEIVEGSLRGAVLWDEVKDNLKRPALDLTAGQQQRLCIARTLAVEPEVILMDEPCSALDPVATLAIEELMQQLKQNYTIVIVTHNMQQAARASDWTGFFWLGEMVEYGETEELFTTPKQQLTEDYITGRLG